MTYPKLGYQTIKTGGEAKRMRSTQDVEPFLTPTTALNRHIILISPSLLIETEYTQQLELLKGNTRKRSNTVIRRQINTGKGQLQRPSCIIVTIPHVMPMPLNFYVELYDQSHPH